tara:strand:+ start:4571 stop:6277 length:1707 start_codon:yes stop_codon:yes gene_type:complete
MLVDTSQRDYYNRRLGQMDTERSSFISHWKDLSEHISPRRGRFDKQDRNKGNRRHKSIINSKGTQALSTARAGLFAGVMSPTRPWFDLATTDPELTQFMPVKVWLEGVARQLRAVFNASNLYNMAPTMLGELLLFGTGCMTQVDDDENLARFYTHTVGSYHIAQNDKFEVNTVARQYQMTAEQMAMEFSEDGGKDISMLSTAVRTALDRNELGAWFDVNHFIEPNDEFRRDNPLSKFKKFKSVKYEPGNNEREMMLSMKGFDEFPAYVPRWATTGEDVYGTDCPGMVTLGDVRQLQLEEKRKAQAIDKMVNPPLTGPSTVRNVPVSQLPGGLTIYDGDSSRNKLESLYNMNINLQDLKEDIMGVERRIDEAFKVDLFLAISNMEGIQPRNQLELSQRDAERLLQLGPVLESIQGEFLDPLISRTFNQLVRAELVPPAPQELQDRPLKVEYVSSLAQAQRSIDTQGLDRLTAYTAGLMEAGLSDGKKFNADIAIERYADFLGTPPKILVDAKVVAEGRAADEAKQQQAEQLQAAQQGAQALASTGQAAQAVGSIDSEGANPVADLLKQG